MNLSAPQSPVATSSVADPSQNRQSTAYHFSLLGEPLRDAWLSAAVICLMTVTMLALFQFPVKRIFANVEVNYNEGWNAYRADMVAKGIRLYGAPPHGLGTSTAYPPISFHLVSLLGSSNTYLLVGRLVSLVSLIATGILAGLIVRKAGASRLTAIFCFLLYEIGIVLLRADRVGMYDPQLLGESLSAAGLYFYVRDPDSKRLLCISALFFCLGGFTKHNLLALPAAVAIDLLLRSWRSFVTWAGAMVVSAGLLTAATMLVDGRYFFTHLLGGGGGRAYSYAVAWSQFHFYVEKFQTLLVIGTAWSIRAFRSRTLFAVAFVLSHGLAFLLGGGYGVDLNIFFNGYMVAVIIFGLALSDLSSALAALRPRALDFSGTMMFGLFFISIATLVPWQLKLDRKAMRELPSAEKEFQSGVAFLKAHPGPAVCESHLLCYEAGKPFEFEPFSVRDQMMTGKIPEAGVLPLLETHHFQAVEVALRSDEKGLSDAELRASLSSDQKDPDKMRRFSPNFMNELLRDYRLSLRTSNMAFFAPN